MTHQEHHPQTCYEAKYGIAMLAFERKQAAMGKRKSLPDLNKPLPPTFDEVVLYARRLGTFKASDIAEYFKASPRQVASQIFHLRQQNLILSDLIRHSGPKKAGIIIHRYVGP